MNTTIWVLYRFYNKRPLDLWAQLHRQEQRQRKEGLLLPSLAIHLRQPGQQVLSGAHYYSFTSTANLATPLGLEVTRQAPLSRRPRGRTITWSPQKSMSCVLGEQRVCGGGVGVGERRGKGHVWLIISKGSRRASNKRCDLKSQTPGRH